ncbi:hypothetical protein [Methanolapillus africanus]|uniref:hypothetical protein n=1 Tax=Methanolapillus africanus TaxID=3028297 RepID=UPI0030B86DC1
MTELLGTEFGKSANGMNHRYPKKPPSCVKPAHADEMTRPLSDCISFKRTLSDFDFSSFLYSFFSFFLSLFSLLSSLFSFSLFSKTIED